MDDEREVINVTLHKIRINKSGYDKYGSFWGIGQPLFHYKFESKDLTYVHRELRAPTRNAAKDMIKKIYPQYNLQFKPHYHDAY